MYFLASLKMIKYYFYTQPNGIKYITPFLDELNIETTIVCLDDINDEFIKKSSLNIIALNENKTPWQYNSKLYNWLLNNLINYDAVIVHGIWLYHTYAVSKAVNTLRKTNELFDIKYFIYPHGMLDGYFQSNKTRKLKAFRNYFYWHLIEHKNLAIADGLIFTSEEEKNIASKTFTNYNIKLEKNPKWSSLRARAWASVPICKGLRAPKSLDNPGASEPQLTPRLRACGSCLWSPLPPSKWGAPT